MTFVVDWAKKNQLSYLFCDTNSKVVEKSDCVFVLNVSVSCSLSAVSVRISPEERPGISDVSPLSGITGLLVFDLTFFPSFFLFCSSA